ncbi:DUF2911 domain-containing protein [Aureisphaera sp.]
MKKSTIITTLLLALMFVFSNEAKAQKFSKMDVSPMDAAAYPSDYRNADKLIKIVYSRPQLKGRSLDKLAPNGKVWRTGANEAAELTLYTDMNLGDTTVKAGTYTFYAIPGDEEWTAIISSDLNVWGSYFYNESNDVARLSVPATNADDSIEAFSIVFDESDNGVDMHLGWGNCRVTVPFTK